VLGRAGERIRPIRDALGQERVDIVQWHAEPCGTADALGLSYLHSAVLSLVRRHADVLLGEIDLPAARSPHARSIGFGTDRLADRCQSHSQLGSARGCAERSEPSAGDPTHRRQHDRIQQPEWSVSAVRIAVTAYHRSS
jgi:hypothetical protein